MKPFNIAVLPGDGIGVDVTTEAVRALEATQQKVGGFALQLTRLPWGVAHHGKTGCIAPEDWLEQLRAFDAILLGALGWPAKLPDHLTIEPIITMRQRFDQYACVRPARLFPGVRCPLAGKGPRDVDVVVIRENSEGEYVSLGGRFHKGGADESAVETSIHTRRAIERILRFGFDMAMKRPKRHLTMITKSNALKYGMVLWDEVFEEIRGQYQGVRADKQHVDAAAMNFIRCPEFFDVVVASNLFGDILTDLGGVIAGGLGLAPSANINPERAFPSMFEPVHGSAPDIAGKGIANPVAAILSAAMMLDFLGLRAAGDRIRAAVERALADACFPPDLGGRLTTSQMGDEILRRLE
jgi:tartrate dehydrogenase/decarboxylase/D-malate dehydrogenase